MKLKAIPQRAGRHCRRAGFTLTEIMVTMGIFMIVIAGVLVSHVAGMKFFQMTASKLSATDNTRRMIGLLGAEVRSAKLIKVGNGTKTSFTETTNGVPQQGNALQIYPTATNTNQWVRYYLDTDQKLKRVTTLYEAARPLVVAEFITNKVVFYSERYDGVVLTDNQNNRVIHLQLQFFQMQYPITAIRPGSLYDYFQINTRITRRTLE